MVGEVDGGGYLSVGKRGVHAGDVQVATVIRPLASIRRHKGRHPAAVGMTQGLTLLCAVGEQVGACREDEVQMKRREMESKRCRWRTASKKKKNEWDRDRRSGTNIWSAKARWKERWGERRRENTS